ncbi:hypothetical protein LC593_32725 [Nostoc sp. CHAB 5844]|nr:hypothetical protein [Nostoc sp. CHAB 5844]
MRTKIQLIRGQDSTDVEAYLVELVQKHVNDYASEWKELTSEYSGARYKTINNSDR